MPTSSGDLLSSRRENLVKFAHTDLLICAQIANLLIFNLIINTNLNRVVKVKSRSATLYYIKYFEHMQ